MKTFHALQGAVLLAALLAAPAFGGPDSGVLAEPKPNQAATQVEIHGTRVTSEAWALAHGHDVDAIIVARLRLKDGKPCKVETYERWSRDGRTKSERGSRALGRAWEKDLWGLLDVSAKDKKRLRRKQGALLDRALEALGPKGQRTVGSHLVAWALTQGMALKGGKRSRARIAIFTYTPSGVATTPGEPTRPDAVTPREQAGAQRPGGRPRGGKSPVTPGTGPDARRPPFRFPLPNSGGGFAGGSTRSEGRADSERGVRQHARVTVDLGRNLPKPKPKPRTPAAPLTPKAR